MLGVQMSYVRPSTYTKGIARNFDAASIVADPAGNSPKNRLFLFLGGTFTVPRMYRDIIAVAAKQGFNAISLEYNDVPSVEKLCRDSTDPKCWGNVREKTFSGRGAAQPSVDETNSIRRRLIALLKYLAIGDPHGNWTAFLKDGQPNWPLIEIGGHSQGGGDAMYIAKHHRLAGACAFAAPADGNKTIASAAWLNEPSQTPPELDYAFGNEMDGLVKFTGLVANWRALQLPGQPTDVDRARPPYSGSHQLYTSKKTLFFLNSHDYPIMDYITPKTSAGFPAFAPVWIYACRL